MRKIKLMNASLEALKDRPPELIPTFGFKIGPDVNFKNFGFKVYAHFTAK